MVKRLELYAANKLFRCLTREMKATAGRGDTSLSLPPHRCLSVFPGIHLPLRGPWTSSPPPLRCWGTQTRLISLLRSAFMRLRRTGLPGTPHTFHRQSSFRTPRTLALRFVRGETCGSMRGTATTMIRSPSGEDDEPRTLSAFSTKESASSGLRRSRTRGTITPLSTSLSSAPTSRELCIFTHKLFSFTHHYSFGSVLGFCHYLQMCLA